LASVTGFPPLAVCSDSFLGLKFFGCKDCSFSKQPLLFPCCRGKRVSLACRACNCWQTARRGGGWSCFTSGAVGINCRYSIEMRSLLWKILIGEGAGFFVDSYHPIPGDKRGRGALLICGTWVFFFSPSTHIQEPRQLKRLV